MELAGVVEATRKEARLFKIGDSVFVNKRHIQCAYNSYSL